MNAGLADLQAMAESAVVEKDTSKVKLRPLPSLETSHKVAGCPLGDLAQRARLTSKMYTRKRPVDEPRSHCHKDPTAGAAAPVAPSGGKQASAATSNQQSTEGGQAMFEISRQMVDDEFFPTAGGQLPTGSSSSPDGVAAHSNITTTDLQKLEQLDQAWSLEVAVKFLRSSVPAHRTKALEGLKAAALRIGADQLAASVLDVDESAQVLFFIVAALGERNHSTRMAAAQLLHALVVGESADQGSEYRHPAQVEGHCTVAEATDVFFTVPVRTSKDRATRLRESKGHYDAEFDDDFATIAEKCRTSFADGLFSLGVEKRIIMFLSQSTAEDIVLSGIFELVLFLIRKATADSHVFVAVLAGHILKAPQLRQATVGRPVELPPMDTPTKECDIDFSGLDEANTADSSIAAQGCGPLLGGQHGKLYFDILAALSAYDRELCRQIRADAQLNLELVQVLHTEALAGLHHGPLVALLQRYAFLEGSFASQGARSSGDGKLVQSSVSVLDLLPVLVHKYRKYGGVRVLNAYLVGAFTAIGADATSFTRSPDDLRALGVELRRYITVQAPHVIISTVTDVDDMLRPYCSSTGDFDCSIAIEAVTDAALAIASIGDLLSLIALYLEQVGPVSHVTAPVSDRTAAQPLVAFLDSLSAVRDAVAKCKLWPVLDGAMRSSQWRRNLGEVVTVAAPLHVSFFTFLRWGGVSWPGLVRQDKTGVHIGEFITERFSWLELAATGLRTASSMNSEAQKPSASQPRGTEGVHSAKALLQLASRATLIATCAVVLGARAEDRSDADSRLATAAASKALDFIELYRELPEACYEVLRLTDSCAAPTRGDSDAAVAHVTKRLTDAGFAALVQDGEKFDTPFPFMLMQWLFERECPSALSWLQFIDGLEGTNYAKTVPLEARLVHALRLQHGGLVCHYVDCCRRQAADLATVVPAESVEKGSRSVWVVLKTLCEEAAAEPVPVEVEHTMRRLTTDKDGKKGDNVSAAAMYKQLLQSHSSLFLASVVTDMLWLPTTPVDYVVGIVRAFAGDAFVYRATHPLFLESAERLQHRWEDPSGPGVYGRIDFTVNEEGTMQTVSDGADCSDLAFLVDVLLTHRGHPSFARHSLLRYIAHQLAFLSVVFRYELVPTLVSQSSFMFDVLVTDNEQLTEYFGKLLLLPPTPLPTELQSAADRALAGGSNAKAAWAAVDAAVAAHQRHVLGY